MSKIALLPGFAVNHMPPHQRIVLLQLEPGSRGAPVLGRNVHVTAFRALQFDNDPITFFRHTIFLLLSRCRKPLMGIEPMTSPLPRVRSTTELQRRVQVGRAGFEPA